MIQEIAPHRLDNQYHPHALRDNARVCVFRGNELLVDHRNDEIILPTGREMEGKIDSYTYLFSLDGVDWVLAESSDMHAPAGFAFESVRSHRALKPQETVFAEMTAWHLYVWYRDNRYCGRCGQKTVPDGRLRMLSCPTCGNQIFPKICPAIIAAVTDGDRILLTRYSGRAYKNYALVAGFTEIGETAEETVKREVMEETGLKVKNIRYWHTQPWGIDTDLLLGFFAELDGADSITMDTEELSEAGWYRRDELQIPADNVSLTNDMIRAFIEGREPK